MPPPQTVSFFKGFKKIRNPVYIDGTGRPDQTYNVTIKILKITSLEVFLAEVDTAAKRIIFIRTPLVTF